MKTNDELIEEFVTAYCVKRPAQPIRWIRSIFYDEEEQIQTILDFMSNLLTQKDAEVAEAIQKLRREEPLYVGKTQYEFYDGDVRWVYNQALDDLVAALTPHPTDDTSDKTK